MTKNKHNLYLGKAGEYRVAAKILADGYNVYVPALDDGVDLIFQGRIKVQVKSARLSVKPRWQQGVYAFSFHKYKLRSLKRGYVSEKANFSAKVDFVVLWGSTEDRFWVVPAHVFDGKSLVYISNCPRWVDLDIEALKEARESGLTYKQIGAQFDTTEAVIRKRLIGDGQTDSKNGQVVREIRQYESRWDLLYEALGTIEEADAIAADPQKILQELEI